MSSMKIRGLIFLFLLPFLIFYTYIKIYAFVRKKIALTSAFLIAFIAIGFQMSTIFYPQWNQKTSFVIFSWIDGLVLSLWAVFILLSILFDAFSLVNSFFFDKINLFHVERRKFLTAVSQSLPFASLGFFFAGLKQAMDGPEVKTVSLNGPAFMKGFKLVQISDLHIGVTIRKDYVQHAVDLVNKLAPDVVVITGDLADGLPDLLAEHCEPLRGIDAKKGVFYVTGNHEYYWGAQAWISKVLELGFTPLINENRKIEFNGGKIIIAGVPDSAAHQFIIEHRVSLQKALADYSDQSHAMSNEYKILLSHRPDHYDEAEAKGVHLEICGHTHAGQFAPFSFLVKMVYRYYKGLYQHGKMSLYVNSGTGYWGPINRFANRSELTIFKFL